jgi:predicted NAD-dependent protein-ADP-ribosyltransferase YbiA (DUF1768 family)
MTVEFHTDAEPNYFLSNFYPHPFRTKTKFPKLAIEFEGEIYPTSEHLYQALKYKNETDDEKEWRRKIRTANTPTIAKYLGHQSLYIHYSWQQNYANIVREFKDKVRYAGDFECIDFKASIMRTALLAKFRVPELRELLLATHPKKLVECSNDKVWGSAGLSLLGTVLMEVREILLDEQVYILFFD